MRQSTSLREKLKTQVDSAGGDVGWSDGPAAFQPKTSVDDWVNMALRCGEAAYKAMELLDTGNTDTYGHPVPTKGSVIRRGKALT